MLPVLTCEDKNETDSVISAELFKNFRNAILATDLFEEQEEEICK